MIRIPRRTAARTAVSAQSGRRCRGLLASLSLLGGAAMAGGLIGCASEASSDPSPASMSDATLETLVANEIPEPVATETVVDLGSLEPVVTEWKFGHFDGKLIRTPNYKLYTTVERDWAEEHAPYFIEAALQHYTSALADLPMPSKPMTSFMFADRRQWMNKTREVLPEQADEFSRLGRGGYATQGITVLYYIDYWGTHDTFAIAAHEGWHQYTQTTFRHSLPIWLEEGIATYMEGFRRQRDGMPSFRADANRERRRTLQRTYYRKQMIPLKDLLEHSPQELLARSKTSMLVYYSQVWALARFLEEGEDGKYRDGLRQALEDAAHGRLVSKLAEARTTPIPRRGSRSYTWTKFGPELVYAYFTTDLEEFEREYLAFVESIAGVRRW